MHGARPSLVDVDDIIPMGKRVDESFPPSEIGNLEFYQITRDFEKSVDKSLFFKIFVSRNCKNETRKSDL